MAAQDLTITNADGSVRTGAIHGFVSSILTLLETTDATHLLLVFDAPGATFRHQLYPLYKAQRPAFPDDLKEALPNIKDVVDALGWPMAEVPGVEADDVLGTAATKLAEYWRGQKELSSFTVSIVSPDKDFFQLLGDGVQVVRPLTAKSVAKLRKDMKAAGRPPPTMYGDKFHVYTADDFRANWEGLEPRQFADVLALCGDQSDNIPGVRGIGAKTAPGIVAAFGSAERAAEAAQAGGDEVPAGMSARAHKLLGDDGALAAVQVCKELVTIRTDLKIPHLRHGLQGRTCGIDALTGDFYFEEPAVPSSADHGIMSLAASCQWPSPSSDASSLRSSAVAALTKLRMTTAWSRWSQLFDLRS